jgi:hypothetical protein
VIGMNTWIRRIAVIGTAALGFTSTGVATGVAAAQDYAPITISPEQVRQLCEQRAPRIEERIERITTRVNGGPEVVGSTAWLQANARKAREAGQTARAERLEQRAERRGDQLTRLADVQHRVDKFQADHCGTK